MGGAARDTSNAPKRPFLARLWRSRVFRAYLILLIASHLVIAAINPDFWVGYGDPPPTDRVTVSTPAMTGDGPRAADEVELAMLRWSPAVVDASRPPIILLHGSPSQGARDWRNFGPLLADAGYEVYALDRPGFGASDKWVPDYSIKAGARYVLAAMDGLGIERAHVVGWSLSGGVVAHMAGMAPDRVASMTLLGATGIQEGEGSGSYAFEHAKYAVGYATLVVLPELLPHFNLIGDRAIRHAFIRDFWDSDQRPLRAILGSVGVPTLILQGRHDPLVHAWVAEEHHELIATSRLVMLDASHFFVFGEPMDDDADMRTAAGVLVEFASRHDAPGVPVLRGAVDLSPERAAAGSVGHLHIDRGTPWWMIIVIIMLGCKVSEDLTVIATGLLVSSGQIDFFVGLLGCFLGIFVGDLLLWALGRYLGRRILKIGWFRKKLPERSLAHWADVLDRHTAKAVFLSRMVPGTRVPMYVAAGMLGRKPLVFIFWFAVAVALWTPILLVVTMLVGPPILGFVENVIEGPAALVVSILLVLVVIKLLSYQATGQGRARLKADLRKLVRREFWPSKIFYIPLVPWYLWLMARDRGVLVWTAANPSVENGGGVAGESKTAILRSMRSGGGRVLHCELLPADADREARTRRAVSMIESIPELGGYPVIMKPDQAQRGQGVWVVRDASQVERYLERMTADAQIQRYHAGPCEAGILWSRIPAPGAATGAMRAEIFAITRKTFPVITGDGEHTLEQLIWKHPRFSLQAKVFLRRHADKVDLVLGKGEQMRIAEAGNHCQGTLFTDGGDMITPELTRAIDEIVRSIRVPAPDGSGGEVEGFDFGRMDVRCTSEAALRAGRDFAIVELNGTTSEATNLYDPGRSIFWSYRVLFRQWSRLSALGRARRREGWKPLTVGRLVAVLRAQRKRHRTPIVAD